MKYKGDQAGNPMAAVNVRCLAGDASSLPVKHFDGRAL